MHQTHVRYLDKPHCQRPPTLITNVQPFGYLRTQGYRSVPSCESRCRIGVRSLALKLNSTQRPQPFSQTLVSGFLVLFVAFSTQALTLPRWLLLPLPLSVHSTGASSICILAICILAIPYLLGPMLTGQPLKSDATCAQRRFNPLFVQV